MYKFKKTDSIKWRENLRNVLNFYKDQITWKDYIDSELRQDFKFGDQRHEEGQIIPEDDEGDVSTTQAMMMIEESKE